MIMAWLYDPGTKVGLDALAQKLFKYEMKSFNEVVKKGENFSNVSIEEATFYAAEDAWMTYLLYFALKKQMELASLTPLLKEAKDVEYPFINVLIGMESLGIKVDQEQLKTLQATLSNELAKLTVITSYSIHYTKLYELSKELGISQKMAKTYIDNYFSRYKGVKRFVDRNNFV